MKTKLPGYFVECLVAAVYDTLGAIGNMNLSHEAGNSLQLAEYINSTHLHNLKFTQTNMVSSTCKLPPGHHQTMEAFVKEIKQQEDKDEKM